MGGGRCSLSVISKTLRELTQERMVPVFLRPSRISRQRSSSARKRTTKRRRLVETLERRNLLATLTVTTLSDELVDDGDVSLREAIISANTDASVDGSAAGAGEDTIRFADTLVDYGKLESIVLADELGQLPLITDDLIIEGPGPDLLSVDGSSTGSRIFQIAEDVTVSIAGLTLRNGDISEATVNDGTERFGGAIFNAGDLTLTRIAGIDNHAEEGGFLYLDKDVVTAKASVQDSVLSGNKADKFGGALRPFVYQELSVIDSIVENNEANQAGAIANNGATILISGSRFTGNTSEAGGGAFRNFGSAVIRDSTFDNNVSQEAGGAIFLGNNDLTIINSTLSGNTAAESGGAIATMDGTEVTLINSTVSNNRSDSDDAGAELGGGLAFGDDDIVTLNNTIVAGNFVGTGTTLNDIAGPVDTVNSFSNLIGDASSSGGLTDGNNGNLIGKDPKLSPLLPLAGGVQRYHLFSADSPAVDGGSNDKAVDETGVALTTDQIGRPRFFDRDGDNVATVDVGAIELDNSTLTLVVTTLDDEVDNSLTSGLSLREAMLIANITTGEDGIRFDDSLFAAAGEQLIQLNNDLGQLPVITDDVEIDGAGVGELAIFGARDSRFFEIAAGVKAEISGMTLISGGVTNSTVVTGKERFGGAIFNAGDLTLVDIFGHANGAEEGGFLYLDQDVAGAEATIRDSVVSANIADSFGGALRVFLDHQLTVIDSVIENNDAANGGAMANGGAIVSISGSRFSGNFSEGEGGAIRSFGSTVIRDSTFNDNDSDSTSGAIFVGNQDLTVINSTFSGNTAREEGGAIGTMDGSEVTLINSTVSNNRSDSDDDGNDLGGGLFFGNDDTVLLQNTIVAGNFAGTGSTVNDIEGPVDADGSLNNLIGDLNSSGGLTDGANGNLVGADPQLGPLTPIGTGRILFHIPATGSPAIDSGSNDQAADDQGTPLTNDQRGLPRLVDGDDDGTATVDIGAVEVDGLPLVLLVTTLFDEDDGTLARGDLGKLSLREAMRLANENVGSDIIRFDDSLFTADGAGIIRLENDLGQLPVITDDVVIEGPGSGQSPLDGIDFFGTIFGSSSGSRIFEIAENVKAEISGFTLVNGSVSSATQVTGKERFGGAIFSAGDLTLIDMFGHANVADQGGFLYLDQDVASAKATIRDSYISANMADSFGGALRVFLGHQLTLINTVVENNMAANGGGMANGGAIVSITNSRFSRNHSDGDGGAIRTFGTTVIRDSTFDNNDSDATSGAIFVGGQSLTVINSTLSGNSAAESGGAIATMDNTEITLINSTVSNNRSDSNDAGDELGGGLAFGDGDIVTLNNTIVAGNFTGAEEAQLFQETVNDIAGQVDIDNSFNNLIGDANSSGGLADGNNGNLVGQDPKLTSLIPMVDGIQRFHLIAADSPAVDAGSNDRAVDSQDAALTTDQILRPRLFDSDGDAIATVDIGAIERQPIANLPPQLIVTTLDDELDLDPLSQLDDLSLREALHLATLNMESEGDQIIFDESLFAEPASMILTLGQLEIGDGVAVTGPGRDRLTIDANQNSRVINVGRGSFDVTLTGLTISGGRTRGGRVDSGGGIRLLSSGATTIRDSRVSGNRTEGDSANGGGIYLDAGSLSLNQSEVSGNSTSGTNAEGGGIFANEYVAVSVSSSEVSDNETTGEGSEGGGIFVDNQTSLSISGSMVAGNQTSGDDSKGGGIFADDSGTVSISNSEVVGNKTSGDESEGGGIFSDTDSTLSIVNSKVTDNHALSQDSSGGGVLATFLTIFGSTISGNSAGERGGGIFAELVSIFDSTISSNSARDNGGGIFAGLLAVSNSTVSGNSADDGGGIYTYDGDISLFNSTITGNFAGDDGGGIYTDDGNISLLNSTVTGNTAGARGGGIYMFDDDFGESLTVKNSILSGNSDNGTAPDFNAPGDPNENLDVEFSLIGDNTGTGLNPAAVGTPDSNGNLIGSSVSPIDPMLAPLAFNGGLTRTHALLENSPAINAGNNDLAKDVDGNILATDQRGFPFARIADAARVDMGAFERQTLDPSFFVVTTTDDEFNDDSDISLREAMNNAGGSVDTEGPETITFAEGLTGTILLELGQLEIPRSITIAGPGADRITIDANGRSRVLDIETEAADVTISGLTITGGQTTGEEEKGGGIRFNPSESSSLTIRDAVITGNRTTGRSSEGGGLYASSGNVALINSSVSGNNTVGNSVDGGGIASGRADLSLTGSTVSGNSTDGSYSFGGGIYAFRGSVTLTNSTLALNHASGRGGGLWFEDSVTRIISSTIAGNTSAAAEGGIGLQADDSGESLTVINSIIAGNTDDGTAPDFRVPQAKDLDVQSSLIGDATGNALVDGDDNNIVGVDWMMVLENDENIPILKSNGGPTDTISLLVNREAPNRDALDNGDASLLPEDVHDLDGDDNMDEAIPFDQRGSVRINEFDIFDNSSTPGTTAGLDIGAVEVIDQTAPELTVPTLTIEGNVAGGVAATDPAIVAFLGGASADDDFDPDPTVSNSTPPAIFPVGDTTITFTAMDRSGNEVSIDGTVTVSDTVSPTVVTQDIVVQLDADGNATISPEQIDNGSSDIVGIADRTLDITTFTIDNVGANTVMLTVTDLGGNATTAPSIVTVQDSVLPVVVTQDITVQLDATGNVTITPEQIDNGSSDAAGIKTLTIDTTTFSIDELGDNTVTLTVTDNNDNVATGTATVTVQDTVVPVVVTQDITVQLDADGNATITPEQIDNGSSDAAGIKTLTLDTNTFSIGELGDNTVTLTVTDNNDNVATGTATVTVQDTAQDTVAPTVVTQDITVQLDANGNATITPAQIDNGSSDAAGIKTLTIDTTTFSIDELGDNTVTLTVTDNNDNVATGTATVTVQDTVAPTVVTQDITVQLDADGNATITPEQIDNGSSDAAGIKTLTLDTTAFTLDELGDNTVTLIVTDNNDNVATGTATVTFQDTVVPVVVTQDITVQLDADGNATITPEQIDNGSSDAAGIKTLALDKMAFTNDDVGDNTVTLSVTDNNDNVATGTATVTIEAPPAKLDFGDAPARYPVTSSEDGARHIVVDSVSLGQEVDSEDDGVESDAADSDGVDDDGVTRISDLIAVSGVDTAASFIVESSQDDLVLNSWIDFNADGDWEDNGEQIFANESLTSGNNVLGYVIPDGSTAGETAARFRISTASDLLPTGEAIDGEVEDYVFMILDGSSNPDTSVNLEGLNASIDIQDGVATISHSGGVLFKAPVANLGKLNLTGTPLFETITLDFTGGSPVPAAGLAANGKGGDDVLVLMGPGVVLDLTGSSPNDVRDVNKVDLMDTASQIVKIDVEAVRNLAPDDGAVEVEGREDDHIEFADSEDWRLDEPKLVDGKFIAVAKHTGDGGETVEATLPNVWQNFITLADVNNDGKITGTDALDIINELSRRAFSATRGGQLQDPLTLTPWPGIYFDVNGSGSVSSIDALQVINALLLVSGSQSDADTEQIVPQSVSRNAEGEDAIASHSTASHIETDAAARVFADWNVDSTPLRTVDIAERAADTEKKTNESSVDELLSSDLF